MGLEQDIQEYIQYNGWNIDYSQSGVTNVWGNVYSVRFEESENCFSAIGYTDPKEGEIVLRRPCEGLLEHTIAETDSQVMANVLVHELGHADSYMFMMPITAGIFVLGIKRAIEMNSVRPVIDGAVGAILSHFVLGEFVAEGCSKLFHDGPFFGTYQLLVPDVVQNSYEYLSTLF